MNRHDERTRTFSGSAPANPGDEPTGTFSGTELPVEAALRLEEICDAFESKWRAKGRPDIWAAALELPESLRPVAVQELIELDIFYRKRAGEQPVAEDYSRRFPEFDSRRFAAVLSGNHDPNAATATGAGIDTAAIADRKLGRFGDYELIEEIAHGGMGVVYRAKDSAIGRDVAIKVLHDRLRDDPMSARRFVEEARIAGQLQHPGIPPVFEIGQLTDGSPFQAMKLIKGRTLAHLLASDPPPDRGHLLVVFEHICQTLAYAHDQGVLHRDLKPANIMVGAFGEVQVMDWGLAKILGKGILPEAIPSLDATTINNPRSDDDGSATRTGAVLGTPAYMPPEQAVGAVDAVDLRADVFGLGAILCTVLTGKPPYLGDSAEATRVMAARGELAEAFERLDRSEAEPELVVLCKRCLAPERTNRPANASEVAVIVAKLRAASVERARQAEVERASAEARATEQRKRRRVQATLGLAFTALVVVGAAFAWWAREERLAQRSRTERDIQMAVEDAFDKYGRARGAGWNLALWAEARASAVHAESKAADASVEVRDRIRALLTEIEQIEKNRRLVAALLDIQASMGDRLLPNGQQDFPGADARYLREFREYGIDLFAIPPEEGAKLLSDIGPEIRVELAAALDNWGYVRYVMTGRMDIAAQIFRITRLLDSDPERNRIRESAAAIDHEALSRIGAALDPAAHSAQTMNLVAVYLYWFRMNDIQEATRFLAKAQPHHLGDFQINHNLAFCLKVERRFPESIRFCTAALALRPRSLAAWVDLIDALRGASRLDEAVATCRQLQQLAPTCYHGYIVAAEVLAQQGRVEESALEYRAAAKTIHVSTMTAASCNNLPIILHKHEWYGDALGLLIRVLDERPDLAAEVRYNAACLAALRAAGYGKDAPGPTERHSYRRKALEWLLADLDALRANLADDPSANLMRVHLKVRHRLRDNDLSDLRNSAKLSELPDDERADWERLWAETRTLEEQTAPAGKLPRSDEPWSRYARFRKFTEKGDWARAGAEHEGFVRLRPTDPKYFLICGNRYAEVGRWAEAKADFDAAFSIRPHADPMHWFEHAILCLRVGDSSGYRRFCKGMIEHFGAEPTAGPLVFAAHTCALAPGALGDQNEVVRLARKRLSMPQQRRDYWARHVLAFALYRADQYAEVEQELATAPMPSGDSPQGILNGFVLAATYQRQGRAKEAQASYAAAAASVRQLPMPKASPEQIPSGWQWRDWVALHLLSEEAAAALGLIAPPPRPKG